MGRERGEGEMEEEGGRRRGGREGGGRGGAGEKRIVSSFHQALSWKCAQLHTNQASC